MASAGSSYGIDYARLSRYMKALALENRLQLLHKLQVPHAVAEIDLQPVRKSVVLSDDRPLTRQAVAEHLKALEEIGLVAEHEPRGEGATRFVVNHARLFEVVDELRRLSLIRPVGPAARQETTTAASQRDLEEPFPEGPVLTLANGPLEGTPFPLSGSGPWRIGRDAGLEVSLPYDPFVSGVNATIVRRRLRWELTPTPDARNGTWLNWRRLSDDEPVVLRGGDTVGVGHSLLVLRA